MFLLVYYTLLTKSFVKQQQTCKFLTSSLLLIGKYIWKLTFVIHMENLSIS